MNKVRNMESHNGNQLPNQFIIETDTAIIFQSYDTVIAKKEGGKVYLDENSWDISNTTGKCRNLFLGESKKETERKINAGIYILTNLN